MSADVPKLHSEQLYKAGEHSLGDWACRLNYDTGRVLAMPAAHLMPKQVRELIAELSALVGLLAREVDRLRS